MTTQAAVAFLRHQLRALHDVVRSLCLALDDVPDAGDEPAIVDAMRGATTEIEGNLESMLSADGSDARIALQCHEALLQLQKTSRELASHTNLIELSRLGAERGIAWRRWSVVVRDALEACEEALQDAAHALAALWREVVHA